LLHFALKIRYKWKERDIRRRLELPMHIISLGVPISLGIIGVAMELYAPTGIALQRCFVAEFPPSCDETPRVECIRGSSESKNLHLSLTVYLVAPACAGIAILTILIYWTARQEYRQSSRNRLNSNNGMREVTVQSIAYGTLFIHNFVWLCMLPAILNYAPAHKAGKDLVHIVLYPLAVISSIMLPFQGFFNMFIFARPRFLRIRKCCGNRALWWVCKETIFGLPLREYFRRPSAGHEYRIGKKASSTPVPSSVEPSSGASNGVDRNRLESSQGGEASGFTLATSNASSSSITTMNNNLTSSAAKDNTGSVLVGVGLHHIQVSDLPHPCAQANETKNEE
jgi:hypothetical protein